MNLELSPFKRAIEQLESSLTYHKNFVHRDPGLALQLRAAAIQAFEFTYELSWKMLKRYLEITAPNPAEIDLMSFSDLIRTGNEKGLLRSDLKNWVVYRESRNITSQAYDEEKAEQVFSKIPLFLKDAKYLFNKLQEKVK